MKSSSVLISAAAVSLFAVSCAQMRYGGDHPVGTGPFDSRGNYVEAWADNPAKWRGGDRKPTPARPREDRPTQATASTGSRPTQQTRPTQTASRPAASSPPSRPQPQQQRRYTVKRGDTLSAIARRHSTTVAGLRRANGISGDLIHPGQVLRIP